MLLLLFLLAKIHPKDPIYSFSGLHGYVEAVGGSLDLKRSFSFTPHGLRLGPPIHFMEKWENGRSRFPDCCAQNEGFFKPNGQI